MEVTTARVVNSTPIELVTLSYEIVLENLKEAIECANDNKEINVSVSKDFVKDLSQALDMKYEISKDLKSLYTYVIGLMINAEITKDKNRKLNCLNESKHILEKLYSSFKRISDNENKKETVMKNTDAIYSGLTYGMNGLNEMVVGSSNRGLKA